MAAGGGPPSASRDRLNHGKCDDLDDKSRCSCTRQLLHSLVRVLPHSVGVLIPTERGRTPILVGSLLQLGGTLVPRSTRQSAKALQVFLLLLDFWIERPEEMAAHLSWTVTDSGKIIWPFLGKVSITNHHQEGKGSMCAMCISYNLYIYRWLAS